MTVSITGSYQHFFFIPCGFTPRIKNNRAYIVAHRIPAVFLRLSTVSLIRVAEFINRCACVIVSEFFSPTFSSIFSSLFFSLVKYLLSRALAALATFHPLHRHFILFLRPVLPPAVPHSSRAYALFFVPSEDYAIVYFLSSSWLKPDHPTDRLLTPRRFVTAVFGE